MAKVTQYRSDPGRAALETAKDRSLTLPVRKSRWGAAKAEYKALFGESPSAILGRQPEVAAATCSAPIGRDNAETCR